MLGHQVLLLTQMKKKKLAKEKDMQKAIIKIKNKFGKNAVLKGNNLEEGATARERNESVGGHKAWVMMTL